MELFYEGKIDNAQLGKHRGERPIPIPGEQAFELPTVKYCLLKCRLLKKTVLITRPTPA